MKNIKYSILFFLLMFSKAWAQENNSAKSAAKSDSIKQQMGMLNIQKTNSILNITDSLTKIINTPTNKINQTLNYTQSQVDTLVQKINNPVDDLNKDIAEHQQSLENKTDALEQRVQTKLSRVESGAQQNIERATDGNMKLLDSNGKIPDLNSKLSGQAEIPDADILPNAKILDSNASLPNVALPTDAIKLPEQKLDVKNLSEKVDVPAIDKVNSISGEMNKIDSKLEEVSKYEEELRNVKENGIDDAEKLPEEIENRVGEREELKVLNEHSQKMAEYQKMTEQYKDKELVEKEILRKAKHLANEEINQFSPAFKVSQKEIAKAKKINPAVQSMKDIVVRRPNEMKGKPFRERFIPGMTLQINNRDKFYIDWAVQLGYRISGRLAAGIGYTYRLSVSEDNVNWVRGEGVSGYRLYTDFGLLKSFYLHGEFEGLSLDIKKQPKLFETTATTIYGSYFGIGKRYSISKKVKGSVVGLYRVNYKGEVPGISKLTLRIGFDYNLKKEKRKLVLPK